MLAALAAGALAARIRLLGSRLGVTAVLLTAVLMGALASRGSPALNLQSSNELNAAAALGGCMLASAVGLSAGSGLSGNAVTGIKAAFSGALSVLCSAAVTLLLAELTGLTPEMLLGALCGALTSTPTLSALCELVPTDGSSAAAGYGAAYIPSLLMTLTAVRLFRRAEGMTKGLAEPKECSSLSTTATLAAAAVSALVGTVAGKLTIPALNYSLGSTAGIMTVGLLTALSVRHLTGLVPEPDCVRLLRTVGLALFLAAKGIPAGGTLTEGKNLIYAIIAVPICFASLMSAYLLSKLLRADAPSLTAGTMTSTPALEEIYRSGSKADITAYSSAYAGALVTSVAAIKIIYKIISRG